MFDPEAILKILDACAANFTFPMLDNGYIYPAATRLALFRSPDDWAMTIEVFGYSYKVSLPDVAIYTIGSRLENRANVDSFVTPEAHAADRDRNPHNDIRVIEPISEGDWQDEETDELLSETARQVTLRGQDVVLPALDDYAKYGIELRDPPQIETYELCRYLATTYRDEVLATADERRFQVPPQCNEILVLNDWHHPDLVNDELPSHTQTFQQLAEALATGDIRHYQPTEMPNTHWSHWPEAGLL